MNNTFFYIFFVLFSILSFGKNNFCNSCIRQKDSIPQKNTLINIAPILTATGNQVYCPGTSMNIVTDFTIVDPDDTGIDAIYIQISSGYVFGQDLIAVTGSHPTISSNWNASTGKLTLAGIIGQPTYTDLISAIKDIQYTNSSSNPSGTRTFSITVGQANYLPSNGHYYQYIPNLGITWTNAKAAAQLSTYYGLQGYLATITAADEAQLAGTQASGAGWIGGSDEQTEGTWKWMTGPEAGNIMVFTFWNTGEPNNQGDEDYAHVTAPGVGITGSWNDLSNTGNTSGDYQPKGYILEYGGMPGDPSLQISTSSSITIPTISTISAASSCGSASVTLQATASIGSVNWYSDATGGTLLHSGPSYTTPTLSSTVAYYVDAFPIGCATAIRVPVVATINEIPVVTINTPNSICGQSTTTILAATTAGIINWFSSPTGGTTIGTGTLFSTPIISEETTFYAEGNNNGCLSITRTPVTIFVYELPEVSDEELILCQGETIPLDAGLSNLIYEWNTTETTQTIDITTPGNYTVKVTSLAPESCSIIKTIQVIQHTTPQIQSVDVNESIITINNSGIGDFEFSLDGITYQDSNVFTIIEGGLYTAYVREKNGCGTDSITFIVLSIPKYFTPNNDGYNDLWSIKGLFYYSNIEVKIFDRFGKLVTVLNNSNQSWDGNLNGKLLPSDDYWYVYKIDNNHPEQKGHFSIKR